MRKWAFEKECEGVKKIIKASGLYGAVENSVVNYDVETVSAMCERYYPERDTMLFPFGEMAIIPDDAQQILKLSIAGKSTSDGYTKRLDFTKLDELCKNLFDWTPAEIDYFFMNSSTTKKRIREINLVKLRARYEGTLAKEKANKGPLDEKEVKASAAAYLLYVLAICIFPSSAGNRVNANFLQLLHPLDKIAEYSWATAIVSHLNTELRKASRSFTSQLNGNTSLLQVIMHFVFHF